MMNGGRDMVAEVMTEKRMKTMMAQPKGRAGEQGSIIGSDSNSDIGSSGDGEDEEDRR